MMAVGDPNAHSELSDESDSKKPKIHLWSPSGSSREARECWEARVSGSIRRAVHTAIFTASLRSRAAVFQSNHVEHPMQPEKDTRIPEKPAVDPLAKSRHKQHSWLFAVMCVLTFTFSGGVVLGVGPLFVAMADEGYFVDECADYADVTGCQYDVINAM